MIILKYKKRILVGIALICIGFLSYNVVMAEMEKKDQNKIVKVKKSSITTVDFNNTKNDITLLYPNQATGGVDEDEPSTTYVVKVNQKGKVINEKKINDPEFSGITLAQKPNMPNLLYASKYGGTYPDFFYTFDLKKKRFIKKKVSYFKHDVMLESISHYGTQTWFQTLTSYKTGTQKPSKGTGFSRTFSNYNTKKSYETPGRFEPVNAPILSLKKYIVYASAGSDDEEYEKSAMVFLNKSTGEAKVYRKKVEPYAYATLYGNETEAYFASTDGWMIRINEDGNKVEKHFSVLNDAHYSATEPMRMINKTQGVQVITKPSRDGETADRHVLVKWSFDKKFGMKKLKPDFWKDDKWYKYLYFNPLTKKSYFVEFNPEKSDKGKLIITSSDFKVIRSIPVEAPIGLDFAID